MSMRGLNRYQNFGLRRQWLEHFFEFKEECFTMGQLGNRQYDSLKVWLREAGFLTSANKGEKSGTPTKLFEKLEFLESNHPLVWAIIWVNLAYNSTIVKWYMLNVAIGERCNSEELVFRLGDDYSPSTRKNAVTSLFEIFKFSPIGSVLKQGIPIPDGRSFQYARLGWENADSVAMLYALYKWAEAMDRYEFTLGQLAAMRENGAAPGVDPVAIFAIPPERFKELLQEISLAYPDYIQTTFVADLDNVKLFPKYRSIDILDLIEK